MAKIFLKETEKPQKAKDKRRFWNRMHIILSLCVVLSVSLLLPQSVSATENSTQKIKLILVDEASGVRIEGAKFDLAEKVNDSYENMEGKTGITVPENGYDLGELNVGEYQLTEVMAPGGYIISSGTIAIQVTAEGVTMTNKANATITTTEDGTYEITVSNATFSVRVAGTGRNVTLPSTGGIGTLPYTISGFMLVSVALVSGLVLRCKRK